MNKMNFNTAFLSMGIFLIFIFDEKRICYAQDFGYEGDKGPTHWGERYNTCFGKHQSPININSLSVKHTVFPPLKFEGFDTPPDKTNVSNNGHTVMLEVDAEKQPSISGGPLNGAYEFSQLHFHWGENDSLGSEDSIDGESFPMELHMVFYKKQYRNSRDALEYHDGLSVLAFFYELADDNNPAYEELSQTINKIVNAKSSASFEKPTTMRKFMGNDLIHYYTYNGSLTTPPCSEVVTWIDFKEPIPLSHKQIDLFRKLQDSHGHTVTHNFRPIQPLGDRIVYFNTGDMDGNGLDSEEEHTISINPNHEIPITIDDDKEHEKHNDDNSNNSESPKQIITGNAQDEYDVGTGEIIEEQTKHNDDLGIQKDIINEQINNNNNLNVESIPVSPKFSKQTTKSPKNGANKIFNFTILIPMNIFILFLIKYLFI